MIRNLYEIDNGFFDPMYGSIELPAPTGRGWKRHLVEDEEHSLPESEMDAVTAAGAHRHMKDHSRPEGAPYAFVISSCGGGIPVYRKLQRSNLTFAAGILYENDMDYRLARLLAQEVVSQKPFTDVTDDALKRASELIHECSKVLYVPFETGDCNRRVQELVDLAESEGKLETVK